MRYDEVKKGVEVSGGIKAKDDSESGENDSTATTGPPTVSSIGVTLGTD
jgi:hypothetical protein